MGRIIPKKPNTKGCVKKNDGFYIRQNKKTGQMYSVQIKNPITEWSDEQNKTRNTFGLKSAAVSKWLQENKDANTDIYQRMVEKHRRQDKYKTLRHMILALYTKVDENGKAVIAI